MATRGGFLAIRDPVSRGPASSGGWWPPWPDRGHAPAPVVLVDMRHHRNRISVVVLIGYALGGDPDKKASVCHGGPSQDPRCIVLAKSPLKVESPFHLSRRSPLKLALGFQTAQPYIPKIQFVEKACGLPWTTPECRSGTIRGDR
jgi:hypothetical protein